MPTKKSARNYGKKITLAIFIVIMNSDKEHEEMLPTTIR